MNDSHQRRVPLFRWIRWIITDIYIHSTLHKKWMILTRVAFSYSEQFDELSNTLMFIAHYAKMNDCEYKAAQRFWWMQEIIPHIEIHRTLHKKWMIFTIVVFSYSDEYHESFHTLPFVVRYVGIESCWLQFCAAVLVSSRKYRTLQDWCHITWKLNDFYQKSCAKQIWWIQKIISLIGIDSILLKKWTILTRVFFSYSDEFKKLSHTFRFITHCIRNEWFSPELYWRIPSNSMNYRGPWDS